MELSHVYLVSSALNLVLAEQVAAAEAQLGTSFPTGYLEFMTRLGSGEYSTFISVHSPEVAVGQLAQHQNTMAQYPQFWEEGVAVLNQEQRHRSIPLASTMDGDAFVFLPAAPDVIYLLPHHSDCIFVADHGLFEALEWFFSSGDYMARASTGFRYFEPHRNRGYTNLNNWRSLSQNSSSLSFDQFKNWLTGLRLHNHLLSNSGEHPAAGQKDQQNNPLVGYLSETGAVAWVDHSQARDFMAFFQEFGGYVACYEGAGVGDLTVQIRFDAQSNSSTLRKILGHLQSNGFLVTEQGTSKP